MPRINKAYRIICDVCAIEKRKEGVLLCTKCQVNVKQIPNADGAMTYANPVTTNKKDDEKYEKKVEEVKEALD